MKAYLIIWGLVLATVTNLYPQTLPTQQPVRCVTMEADRMLRAQFPQLGTRDELESWIQDKMAQRNGSATESVVLTIPVIVHIIHNGEPIGNGTNLSWEQVASQIDVLNEDYRRMMGTPGHNNHPDGADVEIEFCLATIDPDTQVLAEPGVHRVNRNNLSLSSPPYTVSYTKNNIQPATYWDPGRYMNIWTVDLANDFLGYAQLPNSSTLPDLATNYGPATTDGVVIRPTSFGRVGNLEAPYDKGRTTTHEVGHWLGLWHIWGDGPCGSDDYCNDTPAQDSENYGCPANHISCGTVDMVENYMDYTDDMCMNIFTQCQKNRMRTVMENSPRRQTLPSSPVCSGEIPPLAIFEPNTREACEGSTITFYDLSTNSPNSWKWEFPGGVPNSSTSQNPSILYTTAGSYDVQLIVGNAYGWDTLLKEDFILINSAGPNAFFKQNFENGFENWTIDNPDNSTTWEIYQVTGSNQGVRAAGINLYTYAATEARDGLISPIIDLSTNEMVELSFEYAYRPFSNMDDDSLIVYASIDGGSTYPYRMYARSENGSGNFATNSNSLNNFTPSSSQDWCFSGGQWAGCVDIDLSQFDGTKKFRLKFETYNGYGNNIYLDNIVLSGSCAPFVAIDNSLNAEPEIRIYPNPSEGVFTINLNQIYASEIGISIYNLIGQKVWNQSFPVQSGEFGTQLDLRHLPKSAYFLHANWGKNHISQKILVR